MEWATRVGASLQRTNDWDCLPLPLTSAFSKLPRAIWHGLVSQTQIIGLVPYARLALALRPLPPAPPLCDEGK